MSEQMSQPPITNTSPLSAHSPASHNPDPRWGVRIGLMVALAGAIASILFSGRCDACKSADAEFGGINVGLIGTIWYAVLLASAFVWPLSPKVFTGVFLSLGVHITLVTLLILLHKVCIPCLTTATGAVIAAGSLLVIQRPIFKRAILVIPLGFVLGAVGVVAGSQYGDKKTMEQVHSLEQQLVTEKPVVAPGRMYLLLYSRPGCPHCEEFRSQTLPQLQQKYGPIFDVNERPVPGQLPTPIIILLGDSGRVQGIPGNMPLEAWDKPIQYVLKGTPE